MGPLRPERGGEEERTQGFKAKNSFEKKGEAPPPLLCLSSTVSAAVGAAAVRQKRGAQANGCESRFSCIDQEAKERERRKKAESGREVRASKAGGKQ